MRPILLELPGGIPIFGYGMMLCLAFLTAIYFTPWIAKRAGLNPDHVADLAFWVFIPGILGARLTYLIEYPRELHSFFDIFKIWNGGVVLYGGVFGGAIGGLICWRIKRFPLFRMLDVVAFTVALGLMFGRFGCFLNGCCHGDVCDLPWAISFPVESGPWADHVFHQVPDPDRAILLTKTDDPQQIQLKQALLANKYPEFSKGSLPVHPTQLYSSLDGLIFFIVLSLYYPIKRRDGEVMGILLIGYPISRFLIEQLRDDENAFLFGLTIAQVISIALFTFGVCYMIAIHRYKWK